MRLKSTRSHSSLWLSGQAINQNKQPGKLADSRTNARHFRRPLCCFLSGAEQRGGRQPIKINGIVSPAVMTSAGVLGCLSAIPKLRPNVTWIAGLKNMHAHATQQTLKRCLDTVYILPTIHIYYRYISWIASSVISASLRHVPNSLYHTALNQHVIIGLE